MKTVTMDGEKRLSRLVEYAAAVRVPAKPRRLGFLEGEIEVPEDFNRMGEGGSFP